MSETRPRLEVVPGEDAGSEAGTAARLEQSLAASQAALADTRAELGRAEGRLAAFEAHLGAARDRVEGLARQVAALGAFLAEGPTGDASE